LSTHDSEQLRADEWVFHYFRGNVREALAIEMDGQPIKPAHVVSAIRNQLLDERLVLLPIRTETTKQGA
jgi:hypothetical protein